MESALILEQEVMDNETGTEGSAMPHRDGLNESHPCCAETSLGQR